VSCARGCVVAVKVHDVFFAATLCNLASELLLRLGREESKGTSKPSIVETNVSQRDGSKESLTMRGLSVPSQEWGFQKNSRALALSACSSSPFISTRSVESATVALCF
jgi:hypothetical protein